MYEETRLKLEQCVPFRERRLRGKYLVKLALRSLNLEGKYERNEGLSWDEMEEFGKRFDGYRHAWTDVTKDYADLRGSDWLDKVALEQEHMLTLGYQPGFHQLTTNA